MQALDALRAGDIDRAFAELQNDVRRDAANPKLRVFLVQLLAVQGLWERALTQLDVLAQLDAGALEMVQVYRRAILCEALRADVFAGRRSPVIFGRPQPWIALMIEALKCVAAGEAGRAQVLREQAFEAAPAVPGEMDGTSFAWIADADTRLGPVLEAVVEGKYLWIPFNRLKAVRVEPPQDLRDVVWMPAYFTWANGGEAAGLVPTRYPGSAESPDPQLRLARRTDWIEAGEDLFLGLGQRMLATDAGERAFMDVREISLTPPVETDDERAASAAEADVP